MGNSKYIDYGPSASVTRAVETRRSLRDFLPDDVPDETIRQILTTAARAPSGTNTQPWIAYVLKGEPLKKLIDASCDVFNNDREAHKAEQPYYPKKWTEPYLSRRRKIGWDLYGLLGIERGEHEKMHNQHRRNYEFFDAPVGIIFSIKRDLAIGSWLDYGMFLQNVMLLAREAGLHTCPQAAWADFHQVVRENSPMGDDETLVCGLCLGYANPDAIENTLVSERADLDDWVTFSTG